ncbi:MAG: cell shape-determining protein MreD [Parvicellaceae bacterium]|jgi:cell shape-determining protein MreD
MKRFLFVLLIVSHAIGHILSYILAFALGSYYPITKPLALPLSYLALTTGVLFLISAIQVLFKIKNWERLIILPITISSVLILISWPDAAIGFVPNMIILFCAIKKIRGPERVHIGRTI